MRDDVEEEFLGFHDLSADAVARLPPPVRIEIGVASWHDQDSHATTLHGPAEDSTDAARMIRRRDHRDGPEVVAIAPVRQDLAFGFSAIDNVRNFLDHSDAERSNQTRDPVLRTADNSSTNQLLA